MGTGKLSCWEGKTDLFGVGGVVYPTTKNYIVESGLNSKEIEMCTTAESLEHRIQLHPFFTLHKLWSFLPLYNNDSLSLSPVSVPQKKQKIDSCPVI